MRAEFTIVVASEIEAREIENTIASEEYQENVNQALQNSEDPLVSSISQTESISKGTDSEGNF